MDRIIIPVCLVLLRKWQRRLFVASLCISVPFHESGTVALFIGVNHLSMLAKIVEARELFATISSERTFASVSPTGRGRSQGLRDGVEEGQGTRTQCAWPNVPSGYKPCDNGHNHDTGMF